SDVCSCDLSAIEAMSGSDGPRRLVVGSSPDGGAGGSAVGHTAGIVVAVRDSGPGLALEALDRLFDAFYTTKPDGIGMGLAISRSIIEAHGGRLLAEPNEPRGAAFQFTLPVDDEDASPQRP